MRKLNIVSIFALSLVPIASMAASKEGTYKSDGCFHGQHSMTALSKDTMGGSYSGLTSQSAAEGDFWHNTVGRCNGAWTLVTGEMNELGTCEYIDPSGDKFWGVYTRKNREGSWRVHGGTGKYEGMESAGAWVVYTQFPSLPGEIAACFHQTGKYKFK